jgi:hypothetical protein
MSVGSELSKVLDSIGRLKVSEANRTILAGLAIIEDRRRSVHPIERCVRWSAVTAFGLMIGYWKGLFG